jgi:hypothetical protein
VRAAIVIVILAVTAPAANAQGASGGPPEDGMFEGFPAVPPLQDQSAIGNYCIHRNLVYSMGDVLCLGGQGLVCAPPGAATGGRAYWSSAPVSRGEANWSPPAHCGK